MNLTEILNNVFNFQPPPKEKVKRKGPLDAIPSGTEDWASYDAPDEVLDAFRSEAMKTSGINPRSITKPVSRRMRPSFLVVYIDGLLQERRRVTSFLH